MSEIDDLFLDVEDSKVFDKYVYTSGSFIKDNVLYADLLFPTDDETTFEAMSLRMPIMPGFVATALRVQESLQRYTKDQTLFRVQREANGWCHFEHRS